MIQYTLILIGLIYIVTQSTIFSFFRIQIAKLGAIAKLLIYCPACSGFWIGAIISLCGLWPYETGHILISVLQSAISACGIGALWSQYGPEVDVFSIEQKKDA